MDSKPGIDPNSTNNGEPSSRLHSNTKCARWMLWRIQTCATRGASRDVAAYGFAEPGMNPRILSGHTRSPRASSATGVSTAQVLVQIPHSKQVMPDKRPENALANNVLARYAGQRSLSRAPTKDSKTVADTQPHAKAIVVPLAHARFATRKFAAENNLLVARPAGGKRP